MVRHYFDLLRHYADAEPDRPAVTCAGVTLTRAELVRKARALGARYAELGVGRGDTVAVCLPNSVEFPVAALAAWLLGATPVPLSVKLAPAERRGILELAAPAATVGLQPEDAPGIPGVDVSELPGLDGGADIEPVVAPTWKIIPSGGSTGRPKLIAADGEADADRLIGFGGLLRIPVDETVLLPAPLSHNAPFIMTLAGLVNGNHVVLTPRFDPAETLRLIAEHRATFVYLVPTMMQRIWRLPAEVRDAADVSSVRTMYHMAAPCPAWLKHAWIDWLGPEKVMELYAGTELQAVTVIDGVEWLAHPGSVGRPVLGEIECRDPDGRPCRPGEVGELWMRRGTGESNPYRYIGARPRSAGEGWESLGDLGYLDEDGYVFLTDRDTDMILVGGANIFPAEIEAALDRHPSVLTSCVIGLPHEDLGNAIHAIIQPREPVGDAELLAHLAPLLSRNKLPRTFERVDHPLRDDAGKVRRTALRSARVR
ncbi:AMP-binding protein [Pseudonocardia eucalypti]|uniref:AMP-binding protein n=1 Tax=Pseudonocardia eucalypti TaxID=648755 RepID=A0ABP9Q6V0_9PSEU|nr:bile acid-coenzyme A ligase [Pseudonocardia eucalypti]